MPLLLPGLEKIIEMAAIPEVRELATRAKNTLQNVGGFTSHGHEDQESKLLALETEFLKHLVDNLSKDTFVSGFMQMSLEFIAVIFAGYVNQELFDDEAKWEATVADFLSPFLLPKAVLKPLYYPLLDKYRLELEVCFSLKLILDSNCR